MEYAIETRGLIKCYGNRLVVDRVSLCVRRGEIYGLIGKNGAGKTTLMRLLLNLTTADSGAIRLLDNDDPNQARRMIGALVETPALYEKCTVYENMMRFAILSDVDEDDIDKLLSFVGLYEERKVKAERLSLGMRQRLGIAIALLGKPDLLILDEPVNGLDPAGIKEMRDMILELNARGVTFLISSHLLDELVKIATTYGIMANGRLVTELTAEELENQCRSALEFLTDDGERAKQILQAWQPELGITVTGNLVQIHSKMEDASEVNRILVAAGIRVYEIKTATRSPEAFFLERMG